MARTTSRSSAIGCAATRGFQFGYAGVVFETTVSDVDGVNLTGATAIEVTVRADRPTALPIAVTTDYRRHRIPLAEFGPVDLSRVRAVRLAVVEPDSAGFQIAIASIA